MDVIELSKSCRPRVNCGVYSASNLVSLRDLVTNFDHSIFPSYGALLNTAIYFLHFSVDLSAICINAGMLRNATKSTTSRGSLPFECVLSSSSPASFSLKSFSTWLESQHSVTQSDHTAPGPSVLPSTRRYASSRRSPYQKAAEEAEFAQLPRFLRRQKLQGKPPAAPQAVDYTLNKNLSITNFTPSRTPAGSKRGQDRETYSASSNIPATFRSRHYDSSNETAKSEIRLLEPHVLSGRLKRLADAGKVDDAVVMLKNAPLDAQNTQVWNTLIWEALKVNRYQLAYQLYIDVSTDYNIVLALY